MEKALVYGAGGFIGHHMVKRLKKEGYWVCGADLKFPEFAKTEADEFYRIDLREKTAQEQLLSITDFDEVYQFACWMGGAGVIFTGDNDATVMSSSLINLHLCQSLVDMACRPLVFYSSSACIYPQFNQVDPNNPNCEESTAYPAYPDSEYGWEKLFGERLYRAFERNHGIPVRIARYHNVYGPLGTWRGGKEKAPAAMCRKVAATPEGKAIEIWGDGKQTRSFLYIDDCIDATRRLMMIPGDTIPTVNIGSEEMVSIQQLLDMVMDIAKRFRAINYIEGPLGVRGRNSHNRLVKDVLGWEPQVTLREGLEKTYEWIAEQVNRHGYVGG